MATGQEGFQEVKDTELQLFRSELSTVALSIKQMLEKQSPEGAPLSDDDQQTCEWKLSYVMCQSCDKTVGSTIISAYFKILALLLSYAVMPTPRSINSPISGERLPHLVPMSYSCWCEMKFSMFQV